MKDYSLRKNLIYMGMAFYRPRTVIDFFLKDVSIFYSVFPLIIFTLFYEILYILDYLLKDPGFSHVIAHVLQIPDIQYNLYQVFIFPFIHIADFIIFGCVMYGGSRLSREKIDTIKTVSFFVFIFNTIGLVSVLTDSVGFVWESGFLGYIHPITGVIFLMYLKEFIGNQVTTNQWKPLILSFLGLAVAMGFRIIFLG